jgi:hypothetical protein
MRTRRGHSHQRRDWFASFNYGSRPYFRIAASIRSTGIA